MDLRTFRASSMRDALSLVRQELGPDAAVLHTREVRRRNWLRWFGGPRDIEVTASSAVNVPSRLPPRDSSLPPSSSDHAVEMQSVENRSVDTQWEAVQPIEIQPAQIQPVDRVPVEPAHLQVDYRARFRDDLKGQLNELQSMVEDLCERTSQLPKHGLPESLFLMFTDMIDADVDEDLARDLIDRAREGVSVHELIDPTLVKSRIARMIEDEISVTGPLPVYSGKPSTVALVGPTGVGKTTTIAKLAANYRLREKVRVGLITVDTYRIAAVDQLRTYADIIDLPMEVVSTPREIREACARLADLDLILMDTAGRSPRDDVKIQELKSMLAEAKPDAVHLVLSSVASAKSLASTAEKFATVGTTALLLTKLDEAAGLGNLLPLLRDCKLPLSYLTDGQNVPDDIRVADPRHLARITLGMEV